MLLGIKRRLDAGAGHLDGRGKSEREGKREERKWNIDHPSILSPVYVHSSIEGFRVPLDDGQNALYNAVTMLIPDRNVLRCQAELCGPVCQPYNAL